ncbi:hypothetical protein FSP39_011949 [Pinctada imbricata]|uniref:BTB domain-containing protein n=1 Tax=Pinctada imbricata TaxID=66713 RepID=A0AA89BM87_PINIB|nr:hypothetical protein FSP39_011949 [Pinctada imbricata]
MADAGDLRDFTQPDELSDLTIIINGTPLHVHKQYLAEWSPVWRRMFLESFTDHDELKEVQLPDKNIDEFTELLHCIYSTQKPISVHNVAFLLELAEEYQMERITKRCEEFLMNQERSIEILVLAQKFHLKNVYKRCVEFAKTRTLEDLETDPETKNLDPQTLLSIYKGKIEMLLDYSNELKQNEDKMSQERDLLKMEKENMKRSLQSIQKLWDTPNKRCYRHMSDNLYDYSCAECNEKMYREVRKLCGEGQHLRRYFPKIPPK